MQGPLRMSAAVAALLLFAHVPASAALTTGAGVTLRAARRAAGGLNPVTRVAELLQQLSAKIEEEAQSEETLFKKYVCWGSSSIAAKTASNEAAQSRLDMLNTYVSDLAAGRIELTTERADLEKEIGQLHSDVEVAQAQRDKENGDYTDAKSEMEQGITALSDALQILGEATAGSTPQNNLLAVRGGNKVLAGGGFAARSAEAASLAQAADLGERALSRADATFLRRLLTGEVPVYDNKKLNREATFEKKYEARSSRIQAVLAKLLQTFQSNLAEAEKKESNAAALHTKLASAKGSQKAAAEEALVKMEKEMGARGMSKADAVAEVDALAQQKADDTQYITQLQGSLDAKKTEWQERSVLRTKEVAAISQALSILRSDDSRDVSKKSVESQGYSFLQLGRRAGSRSKMAINDVVAELRRVAGGAGGDRRLAALASRVAVVARVGHFDAVYQAIDNMVETLKKEEKTELAQKEQCETDRAADTRSAAVASREIDEMTDTKVRIAAEVTEIDGQISEKNEEIDSNREELKTVATLRADEAKAYLVAKKDDDDAVEVVKQAVAVLKTFYKENGLILLAKKQVPVSAAGEAPPPPPTTWEGTYGGKTGEATGIMSILQIVQEDIGKDIAAATAAEHAAIEAYLTIKSDSEKMILDAQSLVSTLEGTKSKKESEIQTTETDQVAERGELKVYMQRLEDMRSGCDYIAVNYPVRTRNRQIEIDGLVNAKATLQGAVFPDQAQA